MGPWLGGLLGWDRNFRYTQSFNMVFSIGKQEMTRFCTRFFLAKIQAELEGFLLLLSAVDAI